MSDGEAASKDPSVCWFLGSLRPADALLRVVETVRPAGVYGVLHARIEDDLRAPGVRGKFWRGRADLSMLYSMIRDSPHHCLSRPDSFYMCVMASDVTEPAASSILSQRVTPWPNVSLELGGYEAVRKAGLQGYKVQGAVLDFEIARGAKFFLGDESISTFARAIMTSRRCDGIPCNIPYSGRKGFVDTTFR